MMEREAFLDNLAARLRRPRQTTAPSRRVNSVPQHYAAEPFGPADVPTSQWPERFKSELESLGGVAVIVDSPSAASVAVREAIAGFPGDGGITTWARSEFAGWGVDWLWDDAGAVAFTAPSDATPETITALRDSLHDVHIGVTTADVAIVNTGTLLLFTSPDRPRSVSLLPRHHIALVRESQLIARMGDAFPAFADWPGGKPPSSLHFITGPSRSADIENDLTIGVHGPATVTVILWRDAVGQK